MRKKKPFCNSKPVERKNFRQLCGNRARRQTNHTHGTHGSGKGTFTIAAAEEFEPRRRRDAEKKRKKISLR
jgi:hypothetical protein